LTLLFSTLNADAPGKMKTTMLPAVDPTKPKIAVMSGTAILRINAEKVRRKVIKMYIGHDTFSLSISWIVMEEAGCCCWRP